MQLFKPRLPLREQMFLAEHLAVMLKAGIALDRALSTLAEQSTHRAAKRIFSATAEAVRGGNPLSFGLKKFEYTFSALFINMVSAGELSGKLEEALRRAHLQMKKDYELRSKVLSALIYPAFIIVAMFGIGGAMMVYVIPKLIPLFESFGTALPLPTRILIGISKFITSYAIWTALGAVLVIFTIIKLLRGPLKRPWHTLLIHFPILGKLLRNVNVARIARTFSTLLGTDILVVNALTITAEIVGNLRFKEALLYAADQTKQGVAIAESVAQYPALFPPTIHTMISVGEESGNLKELLEEVAEFYEEQVDTITKNISSIIEPILIVLLGVAIGGIAMAILTPMYSIMNQI